MSSLAYFTLFIGRDGKFYFNLKAGNHKIILRCTERYRSKTDALTGIRSVQNNCEDRSNYLVKEAVNGEDYFVLRAKNYEPIGLSETYKQKSGLENGLESVQKNGTTGNIKGEVEQWFEIIIDGKTYSVKSSNITGKEILAMANFNGPMFCLFELKPGGIRSEVRQDAMLTISGCKQFVVVRQD